MKSNELRIGNYVYRQNSKMIKQINDVYQVENINLQSASKYEPIELTEDWLLKFGFKNHTYGSFSLEFKNSEDVFRLFPLTSGGEFNGMWGVSGMPQLQKKIWFVHQLQNLFYSLCGEELEIKNKP